MSRGGGLRRSRVEIGLKPWDVQPLIPIVEGAGGVITSWIGERADTSGDMVVASNPELHAQVIEALNGGTLAD